MHAALLFASLSLFAAPSLTVPGGEVEVGEAGTLALEPIEVSLRSGGTAPGEFGMLWTKLVRSNPESATIGVTVWRFKASEDAPPDVPPVFLLHGGPGWPGLEGDLARPGYYEQEIAPRLQVSDLIVVGQRGIGSCYPSTSCEGFDAEPWADDASVATKAENLQAACSACKQHLESKGFDLSGFNVLEAAGDLEEIRTLLGYDQITLWGTSFGSHWAMAMLRLHPTSVARAVMSGMEGPDHTYDMPSGILEALESMAAQAELSPKLAGRIPDGGLIEALWQIVESVEDEPIEIEVEHPRTREATTIVIDAEVVQTASQGYTGRVGSRRSISTWPADIIALYEGEFERLAQAYIAQADGDDSLRLSTASFYMLDCGSGISAERRKRQDSDPAARLVGALGNYYDMTCPAWGADLGDAFRAGFTTDVPVVVVHGTWDVSTPFSNALECLPLFDDVHFVVVEGGSHGALNEARRQFPEFDAALMDFVASGERTNLPEELRMPPISWAAPHN